MELPLVNWAYQHLGTLGSAVVLAILLGLRFAPALMQAAREKRQAIAEKRNEERLWRERERDEMKRRAQNAEDKLDKILTNHIAHLEARSAAQLAFEQAAVNQLAEMTHQLKEIRLTQGELRGYIGGIKDDVKEIKGAVS